MYMAWISFTRNPRSNLAVIALVAALAAFISIFANNITMSEAELENAYATIPVDAYIMGASATQPPRFNDELYQQILSSGFVAASRAAAECQVHSRDTLRALDSIEMDAALLEYAPGIEWLEGYDESLFAGEQAVCIAPRSAELALGEEARLPMRTRRSVVAVLTVVGLYGSEYDGYNGVTYYCPLPVLRGLYEENGMPFS